MGGMDLVRPLGRSGIPIVVVSPPGFPQCYSRYTRATIEIGDLRDGSETIIEDLIRFGSMQPERPVLMADQDEYLLLISRNRGRLEPYFRYHLADETLIEDLVDKDRFRILAEHLRLPVPAALRLNTQERHPPLLDLTYPLVIKPLTRRDRDRPWVTVAGSAKALRVDDPSAFEAAWPALVAAGQDILAQEMIPGPEHRIESYHAYVDMSGSTTAEFTGREIRTLPIHFGHSTAVVTTDAPDVRDLGRLVVGSLSLRGPAKLDFKRAPDGGLHLLEVNPRLSFWNHPGAIAGVHLAEAMYWDLVGGPTPRYGRARAGVRWLDLLPDALAARAMGMPLIKWLRWAAAAESRAVLALGDPVPFLRGTIWRQRTAISRRILGWTTSDR